MIYQPAWKEDSEREEIGERKEEERVVVNFQLWLHITYICDLLWLLNYVFILK